MEGLKMTFTIENLRNTNPNKVLGVIRIFVGLLILSTGVMKFVSPTLRTAWSEQLIVANIPFYTLNFWVVPIIEIVVGAALALGFFARLGGLIVISILTVATYVHLVANDPTLFPLPSCFDVIPFLRN